MIITRSVNVQKKSVTLLQRHISIKEAFFSLVVFSTSFKMIQTASTIFSNDPKHQVFKNFSTS
jgi:hypothetical protein